MDDRLVALGVTAFAAMAVASVARPTAARIDRTADSASATQERRAPTVPPVESGESLIRQFLGEDTTGHVVVTDSFDLGVLITTLPDPFDSHLDWSFDGQLEAIRRAIETAGYVTDRFWLPGAQDSIELPVVKRRVALREVWPGVMLFRASNVQVHKLLLLFIAPELPTRGIYKESLRAALQQRRDLFTSHILPIRAERADSIRIIGPTFSGSALSLQLVLRSWLTQHPENPVAVVSGTATSLDNLETLDCAALGIQFRATIHPDASLDAAFAEVVKKLDLNPGRVAILRESSTQYGQGLLNQPAAPSEKRPPVCGGKRSPQATTGSSSPDSQVVVIPFPMSISSLRSEYQRVPAAAGADPKLPGTSEAPRLPLDLLDPTRPKEDLPVSSRLSPVALDLMLDDLARTLSRRQIRLVGLLATDVRDKLFLGDEIRKRIPDVQFFTYESNVLYLRSDRSLALRGMLVFSTYPLILDNQWFTADSAQTQRFVFGSDGVEGVYNATLIQLDSTKALLDYRPMRKDNSLHRPSVWLSTVGNQTFLPVAVSDSIADSSYVISGCQKQVRCATPATTWPPVRLSFLPLAALLLSSFWLLVLAIDNLRLDTEFHSSLGPDSSYEHDRRPRADQLAEDSLKLQDRLYHLLRVMAMTGVFIAAWAPIIPLFRRHWTEGLFVLLAILLLAAAIAALLALLSGLAALARLVRRMAVPGWGYLREGPFGGRSDKWMARLDALARPCAFLFGVAYLGLSVWFALDINRLASFWMFFRRSIEIDSLVSPLLPLVISGLGYTAWCTWHVGRVRLLGQHTVFETVCEAELRNRPTPNSVLRSSLRDDLKRCARDLRTIRGRLFRVIPATGALALLGTFGCLALWIQPQFGRSLESLLLQAPGRLPPFDWLFRISVLAMFFATGWAAYRLLVVWQGLRQCLEGFSEMPIVTALDRLPPRLARLTRLSLPGPATLEPQTAVVAVAELQWLHLQRIYETKGPEFNAALGSAGAALAADVERLMHGPAVAPPVDRVGRKALVARFIALHDILRELWRLEPMASDVDALLSSLGKEFDRTDAKSGEAASTALRIRRGFAGPVRLWLRAAEEYAGTRMVEYVEWVTRHLRVLALFMLLSLLLATLLLASYPYPPQSLLRLILLVVMAGTVGTLIVVLVQMNRDEVLSRIDRTEPGKVTWNASFILNLLTFAGLPLLTLLSSEIPELRQILFSWAEPLLRMLAKQ